jgi:hypothetical protein
MIFLVGFFRVDIGNPFVLQQRCYGSGRYQNLFDKGSFPSDEGKFHPMKGNFIQQIVRKQNNISGIGKRNPIVSKLSLLLMDYCTG